MIKNIVTLRIILWHILSLAVLFFIYMAIVPGGHTRYAYDFSKESSFISKLSPAERLEDINEGVQKIIGNPVYFNLQTPRTFDKAVLNIEYKNLNPEKNPLIEAGVLVDNTLWRYKLEPVDNSFLDYFYDNWDVFNKDNLALFVNPSLASSSFDSVDSFLDNLPPSDQIATYNYDLDTDYSLGGHSSSSKEKFIDYDLRGNYQILTYIDNEDLFFDFEFSDLNKNKDSDDIDIFLYYKDQIIDSRHLDDDGVKNDLGGETAGRNIGFDLVNLPKGAYKIEVRAGDDIVTKQISSKQNKISFLNKIWIYNEELSNFKVFSDSDIFYIKTTNPGSLQDVGFSSSTLQLKETFKQYSEKASSSTTEILFDKGDVILAGNGVFSFERGSLFNSNIKKIDSNFNIKNNNIKYILANYKKPTKIGDYFSRDISFDLGSAYREDSAYSFLISIPGLENEDNEADSVDINRISIDLYGTTLFEKVKNILNR